MLGDLLKIAAADPRVSPQASRTVREVFGAEARAAVAAAVAREPDEAARRRLERLADDVER